MYLVCVCNEEHAVVCGGHFKCMRFVQDVLSSFDGQAAVDLLTRIEESNLSKSALTAVLQMWHHCLHSGLEACYGHL